MNRAEILELLNGRGIEYELTEHGAAHNMADISGMPLPYPEAVAKNLFVRDDKKRGYYLITAKGDKRVDLNRFRRDNGIRPLTFASDAELMGLLGLYPGEVTPLGLLNDGERRVRFFLDRAYLDPPGRIGVHPNDNSATIWLCAEDLVALIRGHGNEVSVVEM